MVAANVFGVVQGVLSGGAGPGPLTSASEVSQSQLSAVESVPDYSGSPSVEVNGNAPFFTNTDLARDSFEEYSQLDSLGRCGAAFALVGPETMPDEERGEIDSVKPSGWHAARYDWVDREFLFNRCHLIGYQLTGQNDNALNLITGTRTMNVQGMEPYENQVASYVRRTDNHVLYRVTPFFQGDELVARGVLMEAESIEDNGWGVRYCVWCYNVEPGVTINYATGESASDGTMEAASTTKLLNANPAETAQGSVTAVPGEQEGDQVTYILNVNTHRFHHPDCPSVADIKDKNKLEFHGTREEAIEAGYKPCGICGDWGPVS